MDNIDDSSQENREEKFRASAVDELFDDIGDVANAQQSTAPPDHEPEQAADQPAEPPADVEPIVLTEDTEEAASAALDAAMSEPETTSENDRDPVAKGSAAEGITVDEVRSMIEQLTAVEQRLRGGDLSREEANSTLREASEVLDRFPKSDATFEVLKDELLDAYFLLDRTIRPTLEVPIKPEYTPRSRPSKDKEDKEKQRKAAAAVTRDVTTVKAPRRGRLIAMIVITVLLAGGRIAYFLLVERAADTSQPSLQQRGITGTEGSRVTLRKAGKQSNSFNQGVPVMTYLRVIRSKNGELRATGVAIDLDSKTLKFNYKWFKDGKLIKVENEGLLEADQVEPLATYKVEATATDGKLTSAPMDSAPITIKPKGGK